jgi:hypothetical protein
LEQATCLSCAGRGRFDRYFAALQIQGSFFEIDDHLAKAVQCPRLNFLSGGFSRVDVISGFEVSIFILL